MPLFMIYRQGEPVPNGTKAKFRYFDNYTQKMCTIEMNDHTPTLVALGTVQANNGPHALILAKERHPDQRARLIVGPVDGVQQ